MPLSKIDTSALDTTVSNYWQLRGTVLSPDMPRASVTFSSTFSAKTYAANEQVIADLQNSNNTAGFYSTTTGLWTCPVAGWFLA